MTKKLVLFVIPLLAGALLYSAAHSEVPLPADAEGALDRLRDSPRHGEWVDIEEGRPGDSWHDSVRAWVVYPERATRAPVVIVIHEIYGLTDWIRGVADEMAAAGFIAIAPDLLTGHGPTGETPKDQQEAVKLVRGLRIEDTARRLTSVGRYAAAMPASSGKFGCVGFCWGGSTSFAFAGNEERLGAAVVYYGTSPDKKTLGRIQAPVLGLYGGDDARVNATVPDAVRTLRSLGKSYTPNTFDGAGHGFLRQQQGREGANMKAARQAWPATVAFFKENLETR